MRHSKHSLLFMASLAFVTVSGQSFAQTLTTLYSFTGGSEGGNPAGGPLTLIGSTLYGMTDFGGPDGYGTIFSEPVAGGPPTVLASFNGADGAWPYYGGLTPSANGSTLYGMVSQGGANGDGTAFSIPATGGTPTVLASFNGADGANPLLSLTLSADGSTLYGMTTAGGANGDGTIFSVPVTGGTPTVLASFNGADGASSYGNLTLFGSTLYGTTSSGGANGDGTIFSIPVTGGTPTVLASFNGANGATSTGSLTLIGSTLYGATAQGGANGDGTIFSVPVTGGTPTVLASFNGSDGAYPLGSLAVIGSTLYGMTAQGGAYGGTNIFGGVGEGTVFSVPLTGGTPTMLYSFTGGSDGGLPYASVTPSSDGSTLYGITSRGAEYGHGTVFALTLVPEPSSIVLLCLGAIGLGVIEVHRRMA